jgi:hypothetical protein
MAERQTMTIEEVVRKVIVDAHADVLSEAVRLLAQELMEAEASELVGAVSVGSVWPSRYIARRGGTLQTALWP